MHFPAEIISVANCDRYIKKWLILICQIVQVAMLQLLHMQLTCLQNGLNVHWQRRRWTRGKKKNGLIPIKNNNNNKNTLNVEDWLDCSSCFTELKIKTIFYNTEMLVNRSGSRHVVDSALITSETPAGQDNESRGSTAANTKGWSHLLTLGSIPTCFIWSRSCG